MDYSPIKSMRIKNFRNIGDITLDFNESPIIALIGDNEAGKTSVIKAFCVVGLNAFSKKQVKYIRQGTNGFGIELKLADGTVITRMKTNASNSLSIQNGEDNWAISKIDAGIPVKLQEVMGLIEEPETKELIHVRTYEDQLLFVVTSDSTNYKVMYNALKVDQLTKAVKLGTIEVNGLKQLIDNNNLVCKDLMDSIRSIRIVDTEAISSLKDRLKNQIDTLRKLERAMDIQHRVSSIKEELKAFEICSSLDTVDVVLADKLNKANQLISRVETIQSNLSSYNSLTEAESVDTILATNLNLAIQKLSSIQRLESNLGAYKDLGSVESIDISTLDKLSRAYEYASKVDILKRKLEIFSMGDIHEIKDSSLAKISSLEKSIEYKRKIINLVGFINGIEAKRVELNRLIKESGALVSTCPRCGEDVIIDTSEIGG